MKTVVVTGGAGFIGSHLVNKLIEHHLDVHVIDSLSHGDHKQVHPAVTLHVKDIRSKEASQLVHQLKPNVLFHLAAQADVQQSLMAPDHDLDLNCSWNGKYAGGLSAS